MSLWFGKLLIIIRVFSKFFMQILLHISISAYSALWGWNARLLAWSQYALLHPHKWEVYLFLYYAWMSRSYVFSFLEMVLLLLIRLFLITIFQRCRVINFIDVNCWNMAIAGLRTVFMKPQLTLISFHVFFILINIKTLVWVVLMLRSKLAISCCHAIAKTLIVFIWTSLTQNRLFEFECRIATCSLHS